ncbi:NADH-quinone oxidoreductase subunit I [Thermoflexales bacterium]|nr:NADH-quinone oxidoreductase subunit I [Thermoflexales bacterium]
MYGSGLIKGMGVTFKHFVETYLEDLKYVFKGGRYNDKHLAVRQGPKAKGIFTVQYPEEKLPVPENFRYIPFLVFDTQKNEDRCTSCGICAKVCPPQCIWIVRTNDPKTNRPIPQPAEFYIDATICMSCSLCAEFCPFDAIKMDHDYELASFERFNTLVFDKARLTKPDTYHAAIHPTDWARELQDKEAAARKEAEKAAAAAAKKAAAEAAVAAKAAETDKPADEAQPAA